MKRLVTLLKRLIYRHKTKKKRKKLEKNDSNRLTSLTLAGWSLTCVFFFRTVHATYSYHHALLFLQRIS